MKILFAPAGSDVALFSLVLVLIGAGTNSRADALIDGIQHEALSCLRADHEENRRLHGAVAALANARVEGVIDRCFVSLTAALPDELREEAPLVFIAPLNEFADEIRAEKESNSEAD